MFFKSIFKRKTKELRKKNKYEFEIKHWMDLTRAERIEIDTKEKYAAMIKKKALLKSIRDEYNKLIKKK